MANITKKNFKMIKNRATFKVILARKKDFEIPMHNTILVNNHNNCKYFSRKY